MLYSPALIGNRTEEKKEESLSIPDEPVRYGQRKEVNMGFLMRKNGRGIVSGDVVLHDLIRNLFPDFSERAWRDLIPESKMSVKE